MASAPVGGGAFCRQPARKIRETTRALSCLVVSERPWQFAGMTKRLFCQDRARTKQMRVQLERFCKFELKPAFSINAQNSKAQTLLAHHRSMRFRLVQVSDLNHFDIKTTPLCPLYRTRPNCALSSFPATTPGAWPGAWPSRGSCPGNPR